ncbi:retrovirus-related pol polyprotein from transposon TNT 1-94 [Tanacetum coccineum]
MYPTTNNQLRTSLNPRQQATIYDGKVTVQHVQGRQTTYTAGTTRKYTPRASGKQHRETTTIICYKQQRGGSYFQARKNSILGDPELPDTQTSQTVITHNVGYQADDLDAYDSDCDELNSAMIALMANLSRNGSDALTEIHNPKVRESKLKLYERDDILKMDTIVIPDSDETLMLYFVRQSDLYSEHAYWKATSVPPLYPSPSSITNKVEVPKEFPKLTITSSQSVIMSKSVSNSRNELLNKKDVVDKETSDKLEKCSLRWGYIWRPTGRTFTIVGNACPLTRITTTNEVPSRKPIVLESESPKPVVKLVYSRKPRKNKNTESVSKTKVVQIVLWYLDSGCSKHMTGDRSQLTNFISKFLGTVKFGNDQVAKIMGYGDYQIGNVTISRVYYVEGLGHNLFSVGQFCDSNLEVAFRQHTCFIRNLEGVDLLTGSRGDNLYTLSLGNMMASSPICLLSKASKTKSWLWHRRLSHLNFGAINHLARHGLVRGLPKLKFEKDHLCSACALGKSSKKPHKPKSEDTNQEKLYLLHMDLCGPMRVASVNGKKYILVIVDDYSRFTWVKCLRSKDEAPAFIINFLKMIQVRLKETVRRIRTDNGTEFVNQTLREYYEKVGISHETSVARSPQQNGVVERRNRTLIEAARTMLIYAKAPLFLWAEAVATACYTQNRSMIRRRHGKTPYELLHDKPPDLSYLHVFGALCYPTNDSENLGKLQPKADIGIFIGYAPTKKAFWIYNRRTRRIIETIHVDFDELTAMASEHSSSGPALHEMTPVTISSRLVPNPPSSTPFVPPSRSDWDLLFQPMFDESLNPQPYVDLQVPEVIAPIPEVVAHEHAVSTGSPSSTTVDQDAPSPSYSHTTQETQTPIISHDVEEDNHDIEVAHMGNDPYFGIPIPEVPSDLSSSSDVIHTIVPSDHQLCKRKLMIWSVGGFRNCSSSDKALVIPLRSVDPTLSSVEKARTSTVDTPMVEKSKLDEDKEGKAVDPSHYRGMIGTLLYLTANAVAGDKDTTRSTSGVIQLLGDRLFFGMRSQLTTMALDSIKFPLYCDNKALLHFAATTFNQIQAYRHQAGMRSFTPETLKQLADEVDE